MPESIAAPEVHQSSLQMIAHVTDDEYQAIQTTIRKSLSTGERSEATRAITKLLKGREGSRRLLEAITGAQSMAETRDLTPAVAASRIATHQDLALDPEEQEVLSTRLSSLMGMQEVVTVSRALLLYAQSGEKRYCKSRGFSELIPVFSGVDSLEVEATFIRHTLRIDYHTKSTRETESFFLTMDDRTVKDLHAVLTREIAKSEALSQSMGDTGPRLLHIEGGH